MNEKDRDISRVPQARSGAGDVSRTKPDVYGTSWQKLIGDFRWNGSHLAGITLPELGLWIDLVGQNLADAGSRFLPLRLEPSKIMSFTRLCRSCDICSALPTDRQAIIFFCAPLLFSMGSLALAG